MIFLRPIKRELWNYDNIAENAQLLDEWDFNISQPALASNLHKPVTHPCFAYIGGQIGGTKNNFGASINIRIGFFLLKNRWDLAASASGGFTDNPNNDTTTFTQWSNIGLMSRIHFPIKKLHISPYIGAEMTIYTFGVATSEIKYAGVAGLSWYTGIGSIDIGVRVAEIVSGMGGYMVAPNIQKY